jgi:gluconate:H+ symporter, GntP family
MNGAAAASAFSLILGLVLGIAALLFLVLKTRNHAVTALVVAGSIAGLIGGMKPVAVINSLTKGFGSTLATIGLVIGFGVMMGRLLEVSGAAERIALSFVKWLGEKRVEWALVFTGYIVSIPIFCDSGFVILSPLVKAFAKTTKKSVVTLGVCLAGGLVLTHHCVPPTPGPLGAAGIFGVDIGLMILVGIIVTLPTMAVIVWYARRMGPRVEARMRKEEQELTPRQAFDAFKENEKERGKELPSLAMSLGPILLPVILIFMNTGASLFPNLKDTAIVQILSFIGHPVISVGLGVVLAAYTLCRKMPRSQVIADMEKGVESAGIILLVTGAGGALGGVLRDSGAGNVIGQYASGLPLPPIMIPFIIATIVRLIQGSGTVAIITAAGISAPILANIPHVSVVMAAQACCVGSMCCAYFNDSYFWVVNRILGVKEARDQIRTWTVTTGLCWISSMIVLLIVNAIFG